MLTILTIKSLQRRHDMFSYNTRRSYPIKPGEREHPGGMWFVQRLPLFSRCEPVRHAVSHASSHVTSLLRYVVLYCIGNIENQTFVGRSKLTRGAHILQRFSDIRSSLRVWTLKTAGAPSDPERLDSRLCGAFRLRRASDKGK